MDSLTKGAAKSIGIIGNSIGGLAAAALLHKQGHSVRVLSGPQYTHPLYYGYSRAILPTSMVTECKKLGLFDETIPEASCGARHFFFVRTSLFF